MLNLSLNWSDRHYYSNCNYHLINLELLTKEDIIEINKKVGEKGIAINEGVIDLVYGVANGKYEILQYRASEKNIIERYYLQ